jgi:hypothetical protein
MIVALDSGLPSRGLKLFTDDSGRTSSPVRVQTTRVGERKANSAGVLVPGVIMPLLRLNEGRPPGSPTKARPSVPAETASLANFTF